MSENKKEEPVGPVEAGTVHHDGWGELFRTVFYAVLIAIGIRTVAFEPFNIPSSSMVPTLLVGDFLFVSKFSYGYSRYTVAFGADVFDGRVFGAMPERGDVAVFKLPKDGRTDYIKRVIGLPGDRIRVIDGVLHINGDPVKRERIEDYQVGEVLGRPVMVPQYIETLPNGRTHRIIEQSGDLGGYDNTPVFAVPEGHVFVMGDNRDNSQDSRVLTMVGFVPVENLVGRAEILFFSLGEGTRFWEIWKWPVSIRYSRLFDGIE